MVVYFGDGDVIQAFFGMYPWRVYRMGAERVLRPAGLRTHTIVCLASALIMLISLYGFPDTGGQTRMVDRIAAQVVSGVGFLGAGAIIHDGFSVKGVTTAATLWSVAAIGLGVGAGTMLAASQPRA